VCVCVSVSVCLCVCVPPQKQKLSQEFASLGVLLASFCKSFIILFIVYHNVVKTLWSEELHLANVLLR
jgi:hypothetical protein